MKTKTPKQKLSSKSYKSIKVQFKCNDKEMADIYAKRKLMQQELYTLKKGKLKVVVLQNPDPKLFILELTPKKETDIETINEYLHINKPNGIINYEIISCPGFELKCENQPTVVHEHYIDEIESLLFIEDLNDSLLKPNLEIQVIISNVRLMKKRL